MTLSGEELIRRSLLHILPEGFMRIHHYGFLANRCREAKLAQIRQAIGKAEAQAKQTEPGEVEHDDRESWPPSGGGRLRMVAVVTPQGRPIRAHAPRGIPDRTH